MPLPTDGRPVELSGEVGICHVRTTAGEVWAEAELYAGVFGTLGLITPPETYRTASALLRTGSLVTVVGQVHGSNSLVASAVRSQQQA